ncbi:inositol monophosphatase family protein [Nonomuraea sp. NPDC050680]|uniref:inositol monophosphatase family protein n=1 Tax=Nonomuraea sp. NPDC050680 TaxID=3154630 RepID=UPI0033F2DDC1
MVQILGVDLGLIIDGIRKQFPHHAILGEETGRHGSTTSEMQWLVDPLDGTNNCVMGVPYFGVCITACVDGDPVVRAGCDSRQLGPGLGGVLRQG